MRNDEVVNRAVKQVSDEIVNLIEGGAEFKQVERTLVDILALWDVFIVKDHAFYRVFDQKAAGKALFSSASYSTCLQWVFNNIIQIQLPKRQVIAE
jgi:hypothetical protein